MQRGRTTLLCSLSILILIIGLAGFIIGWSVGWDVIPELVAMNERLEVGRYVIFQGELWQGSLGSTPVILKMDTKTEITEEYKPRNVNGWYQRGWWVIDCFPSA